MAEVGSEWRTEGWGLKGAAVGGGPLGGSRGDGWRWWKGKAGGEGGRWDAGGGVKKGKSVSGRDEGRREREREWMGRYSTERRCAGR